MTQLLVALGLVTFSIFIHELGHFLVARWRGLVVPRFSIFGIGKPIVTWKRRGVEYCICWLPIGAYVMVPQLSDLGDFEGDLPPEARSLPPADYLSKVLVAAAGPATNILFAVIIATVLWVVGVPTPVEFNRTEIEVIRQIETSDGTMVPGPAATAGLQLGDVIREIDGKPVANFEDIVMAVVFGSQVSPDGRRVVDVTFERNGVMQTRRIYPELTGREQLRTIGVEPRTDLIVDVVTKDSPAAEAGLQRGDRVLSVDGRQLTRMADLREHFQKKHDTPSTLVIRRGDKTIETSLQPRLTMLENEPTYLIGITWKLEFVVVHRDPLTQMQNAFQRIYDTFASLLNRQSDVGLRHMSGIIGIVDNLQQAALAGLAPTLMLLLAINLSLAIFNLLPIPVLDGGHIVVATMTKLRGRPPNPILMQKAVAACFVMLIGLIIYVSIHDARRAKDRFEDSVPAAPTKAK